MTASEATKKAIKRYAQTEKGKVARRTSYRRTKGIKTVVTRARVWKFGYYYRPSINKLAALCPDLEGTDQQYYLMCYSDSLDQKIAECALVQIAEGMIYLDRVVENVGIDVAVSGQLTSGSLAYAIGNLVDSFAPEDKETEAYELFHREYRDMAEILLKQELTPEQMASMMLDRTKLVVA